MLPFARKFTVRKSLTWNTINYQSNKSKNYLKRSSNQHTFSDRTAAKIETVRKELNFLYRERDEFLIQRSRQNYYFQGSRPSHLLALRLRNSETFANITAVKSQTGEVLTDQKCINDTFRSFYCDLYSSNSKCEPTSYTSFLSTLNLLHLSESDSESLARPLSLIELTYR